MPDFVLHHGDCLDVLRTLPDNSVDAIVTDPPYGLSAEPDMAEVLRHWLAGDDYQHRGGGFMGKAWDSFVPGPSVWRECLRVLKPGGHLLAFYGSRTYDLGVIAIRLAGLEVRDSIMWLYGSGFPKSKNLDGQWEGWGTALKPAHEPIVVARKPLAGTVAANVLQYGTGALNIDGCRVAGEPVPVFDTVGGRKFEQTHTQPERRTKQVGTSTAGRWPANVIHDGSEEVLAGFPQAGGGFGVRGKGRGVYGGGLDNDIGQVVGYGDAGSAARFFYCAKASRSDRGEGNTHPTVKPTALMRYLCRLVTPPGGVVLDPFMGSGSTGKAAMLEGFRFVGIEREAEYLAIARARITAAMPADLFAA